MNYDFRLVIICVVILCVNRSHSSFILYRKLYSIIADSPMFEEYGHAQTMAMKEESGRHFPLPVELKKRRINRNDRFS